MYQQNAILYYKSLTGYEPEVITHIGNYPEDEPTNFLFEMQYNDTVTYIVCQITDHGLLIRQCTEEEIEQINKT